MKRTNAIVAVAALAGALCLAGCAAQGKTPVAAVVPAPIPAKVAPPPPPPEPRQPLSMPQTVVELPQPQPVPDEAYDQAQSPQPATVPAAVSRPQRPPPAPASKPDPTPVAAAPPPEPERPTIQEILPAVEQKQLQAQATEMRNQARQILDQLKGRVSPQQKDNETMAQVFITQSNDAEKRGDMRQAARFAERSLTLARDLQSGK